MTVPVPVPVQTSLLGLLAQAERRATRRLEAALRGADVTAEQWRVLSLLADGAGHPMSEIASYAMVPAPTLTKIVDRLIDRALVYRRADTNDRRRVLVFLSSRGNQLRGELTDSVRAAEQELSGALGPEDAAYLTELLTRLLDRTR